MAVRVRTVCGNQAASYRIVMSHHFTQAFELWDDEIFWLWCYIAGLLWVTVSSVSLCMQFFCQTQKLCIVWRCTSREGTMCLRIICGTSMDWYSRHTTTQGSCSSFQWAVKSQAGRVLAISGTSQRILLGLKNYIRRTFGAILWVENICRAACKTFKHVIAMHCRLTMW